MAKTSEVDRICAELQAERDKIDALLTMLRNSAAKAPKRARKAKIAADGVFEKAAK